MKTYVNNRAIATVIDGHKVFIKLQHIGFNYANVTISVYHRKAQNVRITIADTDDISVSSRDLDIPSGYLQIFVNTRPFNNTRELLEYVLHSIEEINSFIDFYADQNLVTTELYRVLC